ncbi:MAG TPA: GNAT family N-acetyltransferase [Aldersonia sp.]
MVTVRPAHPDEYVQIGEFTTEVYVGEGFIPASSEYAATLADTEARARDTEIFVGVHNGRVAGSITVARPGSSYAPLAADDELEFRMLAVAKAARGRGLGSTLVRHVLDLAAAEGCRAVVLSTMASMVEARRLYERLGFVRVPERDWEVVPGVLLPVLEYQLSARSINPAPSR